MKKKKTCRHTLKRRACIGKENKNEKKKKEGTGKLINFEANVKVPHKTSADDLKSFVVWGI